VVRLEEKLGRLLEIPVLQMAERAPLYEVEALQVCFSLSFLFSSL
jgi:hypothetical protein